MQKEIKIVNSTTNKPRYRNSTYRPTKRPAIQPQRQRAPLAHESIRYVQVRVTVGDAVRVFHVCVFVVRVGARQRALPPLEAIDRYHRHQPQSQAPTREHQLLEKWQEMGLKLGLAHQRVDDGGRERTPGGERRRAKQVHRRRVFRARLQARVLIEPRLTTRGSAVVLRGILQSNGGRLCHRVRQHCRALGQVGQRLLGGGLQAQARGYKRIGMGCSEDTR